jgi:excisionase family DNA binding protein
MKPELLTTNEAADYLGVTPRSLEVWRCAQRYDIPYIRVGRLIKYRRSDLDAWLASRTVTHTREVGVAQ